VTLSRSITRTAPSTVAATSIVTSQLAVQTRGMGFVDLTDEVEKFLQEAKAKEGALTLFIRHPSASLTIQENADPSVLVDLGTALSRLAPENGAAAGIACGNLVSLFEASLRLLHPVMPFITEEIWHAVYDGNPPLKSIALAAYPQADEKQVDLAAETSMAIVQDLIVAVRNLRAELKVEQKQKVPIQIYAPDAEIKSLLGQNQSAIERLAGVEGVTFVESSLAKVAGARSTARFDVHVVYEKKIDVAAERARLTKELEQVEKEMANGQRQLGNEQFLAKAPAKVADGMRKRLTELEGLREKIRNSLEQLG